MIQTAALVVCLYVIVRYLEMITRATGPNRVWLTIVAAVAILLTLGASASILFAGNPIA